MRRALVVAIGSMAVAAAAAVPATSASAGAGQGAVTLAVYGDAPYGTNPTDTAEFQATPAFIDSVNADPSVSQVVHVGDIHSGKQYCTESYDRSIYDLWTRFADPLVYTPGDNEWADCHKVAEGGGSYNATTQQIDYVSDAGGNPVDYAKGDPVANLALVRSIFFPTPGATLGGGRLRVQSQAQFGDPAHPSDAQYVENVLWKVRDTVFVTLDIPGGSNNDADVWYGAPTMSQAQADEAANRTGADLRWLDHAFAYATSEGASSVVVVEQADMWDLDGKAPSHLSNYEPIVSSLAARTTAFGGSVLLLNGDSHVYRSDNPLSPSAPCTTEASPGGPETTCASEAANHPGYDVPNFHRITVHGSTFPLEWLKLSITGGAPGTGSTAFGPFSWQRMIQS